MRFHTSLTLAVLGATALATPSSQAAGGVVVTNKDATYTMPNLAKATATIKMSTAKAADRPTNVIKGSSLDNTTTSKDFAAAPTIAMTAIVGAGALLLPFLL